MSQHRVIAGRYELTAPIGRGGMGEVWSAYDTRLDRRVAIKMLRPDISAAGTAGRAVIARFKREARLTARLEHPGVPAVFDVGAHESQLYLVMQLVNGVDLADMVDSNGPCSVDWAVAIAAQIAAVLTAAHEVSLVHRDLKPRNIMLAVGGIVTVLDFGVAALLEPELTRVTVIGETIGSPAYMAPEQLTSANVSPRSDLYALGCVLHELLTGEQVFEGVTAAALMYAHLEQAPSPVRTIRPEIPEPIERLVLELLAKDPEDRPDGAEDVYARLRPFLPVAGDTSTPERASDPADPTRPYRFPLAPPPRREAPSATPGHMPVAEALDSAEVRERAADLAEQGRFTQAAALLDNFLQRTPDAPGVRLQFALTLLLGGDYQRALPEYERLARLLAASRGDWDADVLLCRSQAASCRAELGQINESLHEFREVLAAHESHHSPDDAFARDLRNQIGALLAASGDVAGALSEFGSLLADLERKVGPNDDDVVQLREKITKLRRARRG